MFDARAQGPTSGTWVCRFAGQTRGVAQLVEHHVRDVGVACSSHVASIRTVVYVTAVFFVFRPSPADVSPLRLPFSVVLHESRRDGYTICRRVWLIFPAFRCAKRRFSGPFFSMEEVGSGLLKRTENATMNMSVDSSIFLSGFAPSQPERTGISRF